MKKTTLYSAIAATAMISAIPATASAALVNGLAATPGAEYVCNAGAGTPPASCSYGTNVTSGSWFGMDGDGSGVIKNPEKVRIQMLADYDFNNTTAATGGHTGSIDGTESPVSDIWEFFGGTGMHFLTAPMVDNGDGTIDMSGWTVNWNTDTSAIPMGGDTANNAADTGLATFSCGTCNVGDAFTLDYSAHVPLGDASGFGGVLYELHLEGTVSSVSAVPVPAAVWLFGSGLLGLVGVARRKSRA